MNEAIVGVFDHRPTKTLLPRRLVLKESDVVRFGTATARTEGNGASQQMSGSSTTDLQNLAAP
ncbi:hypothetical protein B9Z51_06715 [Limnohabitans sp. T6-5]|nr:hypothetical protein B9Z51_06715 [Limnohabitans sp. T6-5]